MKRFAWLLALPYIVTASTGPYTKWTDDIWGFIEGKDRTTIHIERQWFLSESGETCLDIRGNSLIFFPQSDIEKSFMINKICVEKGLWK